MGATAQTSPAFSPRVPARSGEESATRRLSIIWLVPILAVLVAAAIAIGVFALTSAPSTSSLHREVSSLRHDVGALHHDLGALRLKMASQHRALAASQARIASLRKASLLAASLANVSELNSSVHRLQICLPQLQQELSGLTVQTTNTNGWLTNAYLTNPTIVSRDCSRTLTGLSSR